MFMAEGNERGEGCALVRSGYRRLAQDPNQQLLIRNVDDAFKFIERTGLHAIDIRFREAAEQNIHLLDAAMRSPPQKPAASCLEIIGPLIHGAA